MPEYLEEGLVIVAGVILAVFVYSFVNSLLVSFGFTSLSRSLVL